MCDLDLLALFVTDRLVVGCNHTKYYLYPSRHSKVLSHTQWDDYMQRQTDRVISIYPRILQGV